MLSFLVAMVQGNFPVATLQVRGWEILGPHEHLQGVTCHCYQEAVFHVMSFRHWLVHTDPKVSVFPPDELDSQRPRNVCLFAYLLSFQVSQHLIHFSLLGQQESVRVLMDWIGITNVSAVVNYQSSHMWLLLLWTCPGIQLTPPASGLLRCWGLAWHLRPLLGVAHVALFVPKSCLVPPTWLLHSDPVWCLYPALALSWLHALFWQEFSVELEPISWLCTVLWQIFRLGSTRLHDVSRGLFSCAVITLLHCPIISSSFASARRDDWSCTLGCHNDALSFPSCSSWYFRSTTVW